MKKFKLLEIINVKDMAPYYDLVCRDLGWPKSELIHKDMLERNAKTLETLDEQIRDAVDNLSVIEVKEAYLKKADYLTQIGDKDAAVTTLGQAYDHTVALGCKLDNVFHCIRLGLFFMDFDLTQRNLQRAETLIEEGADWHSRNCYKICKALYSLATRDFPTATDLLISMISTFVCTELIPFKDFVRYTVISSFLTMTRREVKKNLIDNAEIQQALHLDKTLREYVSSLYQCDYRLFFLRLADVEVAMKGDMLLNAHYKFYVREMKIKAYDQLLSTYISVGLEYMAEQFGVAVDYIEEDLSGFIAGGRLNYKIDKVSGKVVNMETNSKEEVFKSVVKHGDLLLNRIHKLSRVIDI